MTWNMSFNLSQFEERATITRFKRMYCYILTEMVKGISGNFLKIYSLLKFHSSISYYYYYYMYYKVGRKIQLILVLKSIINLRKTYAISPDFILLRN